MHMCVHYTYYILIHVHMSCAADPPPMMGKGKINHLPSLTI